MYPISISTEEELHCSCSDCSWEEDRSGHLDVIRGQNDAAVHALDTGHTVIEDAQYHKIISATLA